ncbi:hypothetical protein Mapa_007255 [Marchantia paleacea]|nr:hypothetical protein Mapa_007255 [Marchantia paleacea]
MSLSRAVVMTMLGQPGPSVQLHVKPHNFRTFIDHQTYEAASPNRVEISVTRLIKKLVESVWWHPSYLLPVFSTLIEHPDLDAVDCWLQSNSPHQEQPAITLHYTGCHQAFRHSSLDLAPKASFQVVRKNAIWTIGDRIETPIAVRKS